MLHSPRQLIREASPLGGDPGATPSRRPALPEDVLREASTRLQIIALLGAILWIVGPGLDHLALHSPLGAPDVIAALSAVLSLGLFLYTRWSAKSPAFLLDLGLVFQIFTAAAIALLLHLSPEAAGYEIRPVFTWIGIVVLLFAAIIPHSPAKTFFASLISVSMGPLAMLLARARGVWDFGPTSNVLLMHYPDYILVGVATVISHVVTGLGKQVTRARELGSYQVGDLLGKGGMGEVYLATHRMLARPAAIKLIRPETLSGRDSAERELAVKRFHREAEAAARLRSPHSVEIYDFGTTEDGTLYFVMELLEGMNLETLVREHGPLPANRVIYILRQVCESLEEAHSRGLIHRDIKPANLHLGTLGLRHDFVKVLDFGLVKSVRTRSSDSSLATEIGMTPGTPDYMAPETTMGDEVDARADLYALGCVGYFLLTGKQVFEAANVFHMIARHLNDEPLPPSQRIGVVLPPELDRLILRCLGKKPDDRPRSAAELGRALAAIELPPWDEAQAAAWWRSFRGPERSA